MVSSSPEALGGPSEDVASPVRLGGTTHVFFFPHLKVEGLHLFLWPLSGNKMRRQAFHRELRSSQLRPLDIPLEILSFPDWVPFREWCS